MHFGLYFDIFQFTLALPLFPPNMAVYVYERYRMVPQIEQLYIDGIQMVYEWTSVENRGGTLENVYVQLTGHTRVIFHIYVWSYCMVHKWVYACSSWGTHEESVLTCGAIAWYTNNDLGRYAKHIRSVDWAVMVIVVRLWRGKPQEFLKPYNWAVYGLCIELVANQMSE